MWKWCAHNKIKAINHYSWQVRFTQPLLWSGNSMSRPHAATSNNATLKVNRTRFDYIRRDRPHTSEAGARNLPHTIGPKTKQMAWGNHTPEGHADLFNTVVRSARAPCSNLLGLLFFFHQFKKKFKSDIIHFGVILADTTELSLV